MDGHCFNCGRLIVMKKDVKGRPFYHCGACGETRFFYDGVKECGDYVKLVVTKNGGYTAYCRSHGVRIFRPVRYDIFGEKIREGETVRL